MRIGISTTGHSLRVLRKLKEHQIPDFFELGISNSTMAHRLISLLQNKIETMHALPFLEEGEEDFMFNPCTDPTGAAEMVNLMIERAVGHGLDYKVYGVHAGLLGAITIPRIFKVSRKISFEEGLKNLQNFKRLLKTDKVILENIYGWDKDSPAIGMGKGELTEMARVKPLLLDLGHVAVNLEHYMNLNLEKLTIEELDVKEVHVSFVNFNGPPPWDHMKYSNTPVNNRILLKLNELASLNPDLSVILEIYGGFKTIQKHIEFIRNRIKSL